MFYVVLDLEWNQYHNPMWTPVSRQGVMMHEEIIQIGAVKTDHNMNPVDTFNLFVRLGGRRRLDRYVKKLTHISEDDLLTGEDFPAAAEMFAAWLQDVDAVISWGPDDRRVYMNNLAFHGITPPSVAWFDGQKIYASQYPDHKGLALKDFAQSLNIHVNLTLHDAMNDAILTGFCMRALDMEKGIKEYAKPKPAAEGEPSPVAVSKTHRHNDKQAAWAEACAGLMHCPECLKPLEWLEGEKGSIDRWYKNARCPEHGEYIIRGEFQGTRSHQLKLTFYKPTEDVLAMIEKELNPTKSKRRRRKKKSAAADKPPVLTGEELLNTAIAFAVNAHKEQALAPSTAPYIVHPMEVTQILSTMTDDWALLAAGMLHDTLTMCPDVTSEKLDATFGAHVCALVEAESERCVNLSGKLDSKLFTDAGEEELKLLLADTLSGLRSISRSANAEFWESMGGKDAKKQMGGFYRDMLRVLKPLESAAAYIEYEKTVKAVFGRFKL